jgi:hypothetical protein
MTVPEMPRLITEPGPGGGGANPGWEAETFGGSVTTGMNAVGAVPMSSMWRGRGEIGIDPLTSGGLGLDSSGSRNGTVPRFTDRRSGSCGKALALALPIGAALGGAGEAGLGIP